MAEYGTGADDSRPKSHSDHTVILALKGSTNASLPHQMLPDAFSSVCVQRQHAVAADSTSNVPFNTCEPPGEAV